MTALVNTGPQAAEAAEGTLHVFSGIAAFNAAQRMATALSSSTLVPKEYQGASGLPNCLIAMEISARIGASPLMVMQNMVVIHGRPTWSSKFLIATVNASGRFSPLRFVFDDKENPTRCHAVATDKATGEVLEGETITLELARKEGWWSRKDRHGNETSKWRTMPGQMFRYRAASWWVNVYCPEIALGLMTQEEAIDVQAVSVSQIAAPAQPPTAALPAEVAAAAAPAPVMSEQQQQQLITAMRRQLSAIGQNAFVADALRTYSCSKPQELPAEAHSSLMRGLGDPGNRERWNRGCGANGDQLLSDAQIAEIEAQQQAATAEQEPVAPAAPAAPATPAPQRRAQPQPAAPAAAAPPAEAAQPAEAGGSPLQTELV
jgi:hypothetical protein